MTNKVGYGSFSLLIFILAMVFSFSFGTNFCLGDSILNLLGLKAWSNGDSGFHYTILYSIVFLMLGWLLGIKFPNNLGSTLGRKLSIFFAILLTIILFWSF
ncbi:MAG: hypothetical protein H0Z35_03225 [Thermoanaerobacteraceae bacterium]|nr:hypothetical protein [Thermoanaerobacteraceae bacterium]